MPKRKRTQRIEEISRRAFADAVGERFLFRDDVPDYGIDGSASAMTAARRLSESLAVAEEIDAAEPDPEDNTSAIFTLTSRRHANSLSEEEKSEYVEAMRKRIARRESAGEAIEASREVLSLGNMLRFEHDAPAAVELYERAAELDPEYRERTHYWYELAGVYFLSGSYEKSAGAYSQTLKLGADEWAQLLRADALLFAGRYAEARELLTEALPLVESLERGAEYPLKVGLLEVLVDARDIESQDRDPAGAAKALKVFEGGGNPEREEAISHCWEAIDLDGLTPVAWWNLASAIEKEGELETAGLMYLNAALCQPVDAEAWAFAFVQLWQGGRDELLPMVLLTGERLTGNRVIPEINRLMTTTHMEPQTRGELIKILGAMVEDLSEPRRDGLELRMVGTGEDVKSFRLPGARTRDP